MSLFTQGESGGSGQRYNVATTTERKDMGNTLCKMCYKKEDLVPWGNTERVSGVGRSRQI